MGQPYSWRSGVWAALVLCSCASTAAGQAVVPPSRSPEQVVATADESRRTVHTLTLTSALTGGRDSAGIAGATGGVGGDVSTGAANAFADLGLSYSSSRGSRRFGVSGRGYVNSYPTSAIQSGFGADMSVGGETALGRRTRAAANVIGRYDPFFSLGAFTPAPATGEGVPSPEMSPVNALIVNQHVWTTMGTASLVREWNPRQSTTVAYTLQSMDRRGSVGNDSTTHGGQLTHGLALGRSMQVSGGYQYSQSELTDVNNPARSGTFSAHGGEFRVTLLRRLSRTRRVRLSGGAGAQRVDVIDLNDRVTPYWVPTGIGEVRVDIGRSWALSGDFRRAASTLSGVSQQVLTSNVATFGAGGALGSKASLAVTGGWSGGDAGLGDTPGAFTVYSLAGQFGYALSRCCSTIVNYTVYDYRYSGFADAPLTLPSHFTRGAVRAGMSISLPVIGRPSQGGARRPRRS